jgi:hypothetical protein
MHASRNTFTATEIQHDGKRLVFSEPVQMKLVFSKGLIAIECDLEITETGDDFSSAWKNLCGKILWHWNRPSLRAKTFRGKDVREEAVYEAVNFKCVANS